MIKYKKMDLFDAPKGSILVHACNAQGVWGSGIAPKFKKRFPTSYDEYKDFCYASGVGQALLTSDNIGCLITSDKYGDLKDTPEQIIIQTILALDDLIQNYPLNESIYSNKFNSGKFNVPWEKTEKVLKYFVERYNLDWTVCEI